MGVYYGFSYLASQDAWFRDKDDNLFKKNMVSGAGGLAALAK